MNVRIIAGKYGGRRLNAPDNSRTHPMSERVRGSLFNSLADALEGADVLDAFAGTGVVGLEALSRGARYLTLIERDRVAQKVILENVSLLDVNEQSKLIKTSVSNWLMTNQSAEFDIIFADPPYHDPQFSTVKKLMGLLKPGGFMVLSHPGKGEVPTEQGVVVVDNRSYGGANLTFYRREGL